MPKTDPDSRHARKSGAIRWLHTGTCRIVVVSKIGLTPQAYGKSHHYTRKFTQTANQSKLLDGINFSL